LHKLDPVPVGIFNNRNIHAGSEFGDRHNDLITGIITGIDGLFQVIDRNRPVAMNSETNTPAGSIETAIELLYSAFSEEDPAVRNCLLARAVVEDVAHWSRMGMQGSRQDLFDAIGEFLEHSSGLCLHLVGEVQTFRDVARAAWELRAVGSRWNHAGDTKKFCKIFCLNR
jgi:hypothetical protein